MEGRDTGLLLNKEDIELHREYFKEMVDLLGIITLYRSPKVQDRDLYGEIDAIYNQPIPVGCIFDEHPTIWTMKKLGWNSELSESMSVIHVPYDLPGLRAGALFIIPSGIDKSQGRVFRVEKMSTTMVYPASIACEIGPVFENEFEKCNMHDYQNSRFTLLKEEE